MHESRGQGHLVTGMDEYVESWTMADMETNTFFNPWMFELGVTKVQVTLYF